MKSINILTLATILLGVFFLSSCQKEEFDNTTAEEEEVTEMITCDMEAEIEEADPGILTVNIEGGTAPFLYQWSNDEDLNSITVNMDGIYSVTITDSEGCAAESEYSVENTDFCNSFEAGIEVIEEGLIVSATGGTAPYLYLWSTGEETSTISNTLDGEYSVTVYDSNGCVLFESISISNSDPCSSLEVDIEEDSGLLTPIVVGGTQPYTYSWSNGATTMIIDAVDDGTYFITVTDSNGCMVTTSIIVSNNDDCNSFESEIQNTNSTLSVLHAGGIAPYTYEWSTGETTSTISATTTGTYSNTITDSNGCVSFSSIEI